MIVINIQFLTLIGMPQAEADAIARQPSDGALAVSHIFSFGGAGDPRSFEEAKAAKVTTLMLVGMSDRYRCARNMGIEVRQVCTTDFSARTPTAEETIEICALLDASAHPSASRIAECLRSDGIAARAIQIGTIIGNLGKPAVDAQSQSTPVVEAVDDRDNDGAITVRALIELLQKLPGDLPVYLGDWNEQYAFDKPMEDDDAPRIVGPTPFGDRGDRIVGSQPRRVLIGTGR